jgi:lysozyme
MIKPAFIDLSHHNVISESLRPAKQSGILGVIHKVTEGTSFVDSKVDSRYHLAKDAGLLWGLYHFVSPGNAIRQAEFFVDTSVALKVIDDRTLLCLDYEGEGFNLDQVYEFLRHVEKMTGHEPLLYSGHVLKEALGGRPDPRLSPYRLWLAQYGPEAVLPPGWTKYWGWQYTETGSCPGINPPVDLNAFDGTATELRDSWSGARPDEDEGVVQVDLYVKSPPGVRVAVNVHQEE